MIAFSRDGQNDISCRPVAADITVEQLRIDHDLLAGVTAWRASRGQRSGTLGQVELVAGVEIVVTLAIVILSVPDGDAAGAVIHKHVLVDRDRSALVESQT